MSDLTDKILEDNQQSKGQETRTEKNQDENKHAPTEPKDRYFSTFRGIKGQLAHDCDVVRQEAYHGAKAKAEEVTRWSDDPDTKAKQEQEVEARAKKAYSQALPEKPLAVARFLVERLRFVRIKPAGHDQKAPLYFYNPDLGVYQKNTEFLKDLIFVIAPNLNEKQAQDVIYKIERQTVERDNLTHYTALGNMLYNAKTGELEPFSYKVITIRKIKTDYKAGAVEPNIKGWKVTEWLRSLFGGDDELYRLSIQILRACVTGQSLEKLFWLYGQGGTGKGTFQQLIINLVGLENVASLKITGLTRSRFTTSILLDKSVVIGDDIQQNAVIKDTSELFSLVTGDLLTVEEKSKQPFSLNLSLTVIQSSNGMPNLDGDSEAIGRRFRILPFTGDFVGKPNKAIKKDYINRPEVLEYLLKLALETPLADINPKISQIELDRFKLDVNPVLAFVSDFFTDQLESSFLPNSFVWFVWREFLEYTAHASNLKENALHREIGKILPPNFEKGQKVTPAGRELPRGFYPKSDLPPYVRRVYRTGRDLPEQRGKARNERGYTRKT